VQAHFRRGAADESHLYYGVDGRLELDADGVGFDGELLFRRQGPTGAAAEAHRFRRLVLDGVLDVTAAAEIDTLILEEDRCEIQIEAGRAAGLKLKTRAGIRLFVNGQPASDTDTGVGLQMVSA
jgi:hypothetical protein